ncbi:MAG: NADH-quinone oxidoreductase subunit L [Rickettsiaceae bacterium]|nr:NADH-quinone oxidoreductase subunit L [Rickettsiaceae bacterium]
MSFLILALGRNMLSKKMAQLIASSCIIVATVITYWLAATGAFYENFIHITLGDWVRINEFYVSWGIYIDSLTITMMIVVLSISSLVHIYSIGYMQKDKNFVRFMSYLSLFTFAMLVLISSNNFLQLFLGWEGVGLCSYLLIGFWYHKPSATYAANKAFIVNRFADAAFVLAILFMSYYCNSLDLHGVFPYVKELSDLGFYGDFSVLDAICFCLLIAAVGKSAQIILHIWLADAMEGPTPVSALIHAATMVTAGVFLLTRCSYLFEFSNLLDIISLLGLVTLIYAGIMALVQSDLKKIIAFSTCSQLGYMFLACGLSSYNLAIFHLSTHAVFKALLFLCAGSVIHATHEQNIYKMEPGLYKKMPITYITFVIGSLSIMGIYPFAGYFSKDAIIMAAEAKHPALFIGSGVIGVFLTVIYSMKIWLFVFHAKANNKLERQNKELHESPSSMLIPMIILAIASLFVGRYCAQIFSSETEDLYLNNAIYILNKKSYNHDNFAGQNYIYFFIFCGVCVAFAYYFSNNLRGILTKISVAIFDYFDVFYSKVVVSNFKKLAKFSSVFDSGVIDFCGPMILQNLVLTSNKIIKRIHNGYVISYTSYMILFFILLICYVAVEFNNNLLPIEGF